MENTITKGNIRDYILAYQLDDMETLNELTEDERASLAQTLVESKEGAIEREPLYVGPDGGADWKEWATDVIYRNYIVNYELLEEETAE